MTKNKFLKELDKSLYVLAEVERNDIINEYRDIIEEKIKHGKTEKEAVEEFGTIEELSREILSAYKVNPDYGKKDDEFTKSAKKLGSDFDSFIKKGARKATDITKEIVEEIKQCDNEITIEFVFELLFKGFATLIIMFLASIPFAIIRELGSSILDNIPLSGILIFIWTLVITVLYIGCCVLIFIAMFKQYFGKRDTKVIVPIVKEKESNTKRDSKEEKKEEVLVSTNNQLGDKDSNITKEKKGTPLIDIFLILVKIITLPLIFIPLAIFNICMVLGIGGVCYLFIKGLFIPGIIILLVGILLFSAHLQNCLFKVIFKPGKIHFYPFVIAIILGVVGGIMCFDQALNMNYYDYAPKVDYKETVKELIIDSKTTEIALSYMGMNIDYKIDPTLKDNQIKIITKNYDQFGQVSVIDNGITSNYNYHNINFITLSYSRVGFLSNEQKVINKLFIKNFNDRKIYNYDDLYCPQVTIYTNGKLKINY